MLTELAGPPELAVDRLARPLFIFNFLLCTCIYRAAMRVALFRECQASGITRSGPCLSWRPLSYPSPNPRRSPHRAFDPPRCLALQSSCNRVGATVAGASRWHTNKTCSLLSPITQIAASLMSIFARGLKHPPKVAVERLRHAHVRHLSTSPSFVFCCSRS